jgi:hypothetical protein
LTKTEIITAANLQTEQKAAAISNGDLVKTYYRSVCRDICKRERYWWRRVEFSFPLAANQATYDLTAVTTTPVNRMAELLLDEITKFTIILSPSPYQIAELQPVFDPQALIDLIQNTSPTSPTQGNTQAPGGRYTMDSSGPNVVRIDPPDLDYTAYIVGWGMPNPAVSSTEEVVPLIPAWGHDTIVSGIIAKIFRYAYGSKNAKTIDAVEEYEQGIQDLAARKQFDPNHSVQLILNESAVRST